MSRYKKKFLAFAATLTGGTVFQFLPGSCAEFGAVQVLGTLDFCAVLNCQGGSFFNFCQPIAYLIDCF